MSVVLNSATKTVIKVGLNKARSIAMDIFNDGSNAFTTFEVWLGATNESRGVRWLSTTADYTDPHDKAPVRGVSVSGGDPTTLAAGGSLSLALQLSDSALEAYSYIEIKAASTSGTTAEVQLNAVGA